MATNNNTFNNSGSGKAQQLNKIVDSSNQDLEQMKVGLAKLRNLSKDDRTESAMLRSRIDEQSSLIMTLKNRSDEHLRRNQVLERMNKDLQFTGQHSNDQLRQETKKADMLEQRFSDLASNHEEMIKIKDEYKMANETLRRDNSRLQDENGRIFSQALVDRDQHILELENQKLNLENMCQCLEQRYNVLCAESRTAETSLTDRLKVQETKYSREIRQLQKRLAENEARLKASETELKREVNPGQTTQSDSDTRLKLITKEKEDLLELAMHRGKLIQEKQVENKNLVKNIDELKDSVCLLEEKFQKESSSVDVNKAVTRLRDELDKADRRFRQVNNEFNAYKAHSKKLLDQEKHLNERLRHLAG